MAYPAQEGVGVHITTILVTTDGKLFWHSVGTKEKHSVLGKV